jgi:hypothetical protein
MVVLVGREEFWVRYNPLGCAVGFVRIDVVGDSLEAAQRSFTPLANDQRKEFADGWKYVRVDLGKLRNLTGCLRGRCSHGEWP